MVAVHERTGIGHLLPGEGQREYSADELAVIEDVLDAAAAWQSGALPLDAFWRLGTLRPRAWSHRSGGVNGPVTTCRGLDQAGYSRFTALVYAVKTGDPRRRALLAAIEEAGRLAAQPGAA